MDVKFHTIQLAKWRKLDSKDQLLDITVKNNETHFLAPTWDLVSGSKGGNLSHDDYEMAYRQLLLKRAEDRPDEFKQMILSLNEKVIGCFCDKDKFCHRFLIADILKEIITKHGWEINLQYLGEWGEKAINQSVLKDIKEEVEEEKPIQYDKTRYIKCDNNLFLKQTIDTIPVYPHQVNGLLLVGDPHQSSRRPGLRLDEHFAKTVANKLTQCVQFANEHNLLMVILGDLFDNARDEDAEMLDLTVKALKSAKYTPFIYPGNHDIHEKELTTKNPLNLLNTCGIIEVFKDNGFAYQIDILEGQQVKRILFGVTPYGKPIPDAIPGFLVENEKYRKRIWKPLTKQQINDVKSQEKVNKYTGGVPIYLKTRQSKENWDDFAQIKKDYGIDEIIWFTHHDLAMTGAYPNSEPLKEIIGVDRVFNGHIHGKKMPVIVGGTTYYNYGNITRQKSDTRDHIPTVYIYSPFYKDVEPTVSGLTTMRLTPFILEHVKGEDIFRHNKNNVLNHDDLHIDEEEKVFVNLMQQSTEAALQTQNGELVESSLHHFLETKQDQISEKARLKLIAYMQKALEKNEQTP